MSAYKANKSLENEALTLEGQANPSGQASGEVSLALETTSGTVIDTTADEPPGYSGPVQGSWIQRHPFLVYLALLLVTLISLALTIAVLASAANVSLASYSFEGTTGSYGMGYFTQCYSATNGAASAKICGTYPGGYSSTLTTAQAFAVISCIDLFIILFLQFLLLKSARQGWILFGIGMLFMWELICQIIAVQRIMQVWASPTMMWGGGLQIIMIALAAPSFVLAFYMAAKGMTFQKMCGC